VDRERLPAPGDFAIAGAHRDRTGLRVRIGGDAVFARAKHRESHARRIDLDVLARFEIPYARGQRSLRQLDLRRLIIQV
jgi:hypothetical protein